LNLYRISDGIIQNKFIYFSFGISILRIEDFCRNIEDILHQVEDILHHFEDK